MGICQLARPNVEEYFSVYPSEAGMMRLKKYSGMDRMFEDFLKYKKGTNR